MAGVCSGQSSVLSLPSGSGLPGSLITVQMSLTSVPGTEPAALQWTLGYPSSIISSVTAAAGSAALAAGKSVICYGNTCVLFGGNAQPILNGPVVTLTIQLNGSATGILPLQLTNVTAASPLGNALSTDAVSGAIFINETPTGALSHVAAGGTLTTGIFVLNTGATPASYAIQFYDDTGNALALPFTSGATSLLTGTLPAHGSTYVEAGGLTSPSVTGWGQITADPDIAIQSLFRNNVNGTYYEAAVPSTAGGQEILMPFDDTTFATTGQPFVTGIAVANLDPSNGANIFCTAYSSSGSIIPNAIQIPQLVHLGHWAGYQFPALSGLRGTIECTSNTNLSATALRFLGSELSSFPGRDESRSRRRSDANRSDRADSGGRHFDYGHFRIEWRSGARALHRELFRR